MKKRILSSIVTFAVMCYMLIGSLIHVKASDNFAIDSSRLIEAESSTGSTNTGITTRGAHLMDGECSITKSGRGRIYVYASTTANHDVDYLSVVLYVDRYNEKTGDWGQIAYMQAEDFSTYYVSTTKSMAVDRGYYYRVRATHVAGMNATPPYDEATSFTDGIWID